MNSIVTGGDYHQLRLDLINFCRWRNSESPEDDADETIYRILKNLEAGVVIEKLESYARGIAMHVVQENRRARKRIEETRRNLPPPSASFSDPVLEACFEKCKAALRPQDLHLIEAYYVGEKAVKIENRARLAKELGITVDALRVRAHRVREKLAVCVKQCREELASR